MLSYYQRNKEKVLEKARLLRRLKGVKEKHRINKEVVKPIEFIPKQTIIIFD